LWFRLGLLLCDVSDSAVTCYQGYPKLGIGNTDSATIVTDYLTTFHSGFAASGLIGIYINEYATDGNGPITEYGADLIYPNDFVDVVATSGTPAGLPVNFTVGPSLGPGHAWQFFSAITLWECGGGCKPADHPANVPHVTYGFRYKGSGSFPTIIYMIADLSVDPYGEVQVNYFAFEASCTPIETPAVAGQCPITTSTLQSCPTPTPGSTPTATPTPTLIPTATPTATPHCDAYRNTYSNTNSYCDAYTYCNTNAYSNSHTYPDL